MELGERLTTASAESMCLVVALAEAGCSLRCSCGLVWSSLMGMWSGGSKFGGLEGRTHFGLGTMEE